MKINSKAAASLILSIITIVFCFFLRVNNIYVIIFLWALWISSFAFGLVESKIATFRNGIKFGGWILVLVTVFSAIMVAVRTIFYLKQFVVGD